MKINWKIVSLILGIILFLGAGVMAYKYVSNQSYEQGFANASLLINQQILASLNQNGFIVVYLPYQNTSVPIKLIPQMPE